MMRKITEKESYRNQAGEWLQKGWICVTNEKKVPNYQKKMTKTIGLFLAMRKRRPEIWENGHYERSTRYNFSNLEANSKKQIDDLKNDNQRENFVKLSWYNMYKMWDGT